MERSRFHGCLFLEEATHPGISATKTYLTVAATAVALSSSVGIASAARQVSTLKPYDDVLLKHELLIVDSGNKKVVDVINRHA